MVISSVVRPAALVLYLIVSGLAPSHTLAQSYPAKPEFLKALGHSEIKERLAKNGYEAGGDTPEQFAAVIRDDYARWGKVIREAGIRVE